MNKQTLLEKAKAINGKKVENVTDEDIELALAWVNDEIGVNQVVKVYETSNTNGVYSKLAISLKAHLKKQK